MAADTRPFKSKEQDGQGNEVIIRDQQLVEQTSQTTMASDEYFEIVDVDGRMAKIPKANMMSVVLEAIRLLLDDSGSNISAANLTKILGLSASSIGNILPTDLASVLGVFKSQGVRQSGSYDDVTTSGFYLVSDALSNKPANCWTILIVFNQTNNISQIAICLTEPVGSSIRGKIYARCYSTAYSSWTAWAEH